MTNNYLVKIDVGKKKVNVADTLSYLGDLEVTDGSDSESDN